MTMIDVDTSPLQAAREWRGTSLVAVARSCGLPVTQAEALEDGDTGAFDSIDEMIAAAVLYGASLGIGRDEAMALLDRTVSGEGVQVNLPTAPVARTDFSNAVQHRSARIAARPGDEGFVRIPLTADPVAGPVPVAPVHVPDVPVASAMPAVDHVAPLVAAAIAGVSGPTPEQATAAAAEIALDGTSFTADHGWERPAPRGELDDWAAHGAVPVTDAGPTSSDGTTAAASGFPARAGAWTFTGLERIIGSERADRSAEAVERALARGGEGVRSGRERLRQSEHATLIVAMTGGAVLVALLVAIASSLGGSDGPKVNASNASKPKAPARAVAAKPVVAPKKAAAPAPVLAPAKMTVNIYNAGSQGGAAKRVASELQALGYHTGDVGNAKADYGGSLIIYPKGRAREAQRLSNATGITTMDVAPGSSTDFTLVVV